MMTFFRSLRRGPGGHRDVFAEDQIDAANGVYPASCRNDNSHPSLKGIAVRNTQVLARMQALGWLT